MRLVNPNKPLKWHTNAFAVIVDVFSAGALVGSIDHRYDRSYMWVVFSSDREDRKYPLISSDLMQTFFLSGIVEICRWNERASRRYKS